MSTGGSDTPGLNERTPHTLGQAMSLGGDPDKPAAYYAYRITGSPTST